MQAVAFNDQCASPQRMSASIPPKKAEQRLIGRALRNLRERAKLSLRDVATPQGLSAQGWQYYEVGERSFSAERIEAALAALGAGEHELDVEKARILGTPGAPGSGLGEVSRPFIFDIYGRSRAGAQGPEVYDVQSPSRQVDLRQVLGRHVDGLEVAGDSMSPWAESGELVLFDRERAPRRGKGCVVELTSGEAYVRLYEKSDGSTLFVRELFPEERTVPFPLKQVRGVYPVLFRGD